MGIIVRILAVMLAYALACLAASIVLTVGTLTPAWDDSMPLGLQSAVIWPVVVVGAAMIGAIAMLPTVLAIALAEGFAWRSIVAYAALGGVLALAVHYGLDFADDPGARASSVAREREVLAAAGIAGGLVYWLFAGRKAGSWK